MHIFRLKEGSKSYDWVKGVIDKERKQSLEYCDRIQKMIPFQLKKSHCLLRKLNLFQKVGNLRVCCYS